MAEEKPKEPIIPVQKRLEDLEKAVSVLMGFVNTVLPADFERYKKNEIKLAERAGDVRELKV